MPVKVPADLQPIAAFVQRADELKGSEPIVAYWCMYYAAQIGISIGTKSNEARAYLGSVLEQLESIKHGISADAGVQEVVDHEIQSAAYVETFALKVFNLADNTDRSGKATRTTAKQFLAAANFLELLNVFDSTFREDSYDDKIRYAKWKAADIARAFREGRTPVPGPAGGLEPDQDQVTDIPSTDSVVGARSLPSESSLASIPVTHDETHDSSLGTQAPATTDDTQVTQTGWDPIVENEQLRPVPARAPAQRADSTATIFDGDINAATLPHIEGFPERIDDTTPTYMSPADSSTINDHTTYDVGVSAPTVNDSTSSVLHDDSLDVAYTTPPVPSDVGLPLPPGFIPNSIPSATPFSAAVAPVPPPPILYPQSPPLVIAPPPELTPQLIAKIQRHCKFAVSALDYEDGDTARKELRAALAMLGG